MGIFNNSFFKAAGLFGKGFSSAAKEGGKLFRPMTAGALIGGVGGGGIGYLQYRHAKSEGDEEANAMTSITAGALGGALIGTAAGTLGTAARGAVKGYRGMKGGFSTIRSNRAALLAEKSKNVGRLGGRKWIDGNSQNIKSQRAARENLTKLVKEKRAELASTPNPYKGPFTEGLEKSRAEFASKKKFNIHQFKERAKDGVRRANARKAAAVQPESAPTQATSQAQKKAQETQRLASVLESLKRGKQFREARASELEQIKEIRKNFKLAAEAEGRLSAGAM